MALSYKKRMLIHDQDLGRVELKNIPLPQYMLNVNGTFTYSGRVLVTYSTKEDMDKKDYFNLVTLNHDGSDICEVFSGQIEQLEKANGIRWMCFEDNKRVLLGDYVLEAYPNLDETSSTKLVKVEYPKELTENPLIFCRWSEVIIAPDNTHMSWTTLTLHGAINYLGKLTKKEDKYLIEDICVISSTKMSEKDKDNPGFDIPLPIRGGEVKQFIWGGKALTMVGNGDSISESVVQDLESEDVIQITHTAGYEETTIFSFDEKLGVVMSPRFSPKTDMSILGLIPQPLSLPVRGKIINILYMYAVAGVRAFRPGNIGPVLIDIEKSKTLKRAHKGVNLSDPENKWVYYSPISWHIDSTKAMWVEKTRIVQGPEMCRLRMLELLDYKASPRVKIEKTPSCGQIPYAKPFEGSLDQDFHMDFPLKFKGKFSGYVENKIVEEESPKYVAVYENFSDDGKTFYQGYISVITPSGLFVPGKSIFEADLKVEGEHQGHMKLKLVFNRDSVHAPAMLSFEKDADGLAESRGFSSYDGITLKVEDMLP